jgi:transketolase
MINNKLKELEDISLKVREHIIRLSGKGGCFIGASLSCTDIVTYLYKHFLNVHLENLKDPDRDYLFLSKGHDVPALYGMFVELGWLEKDLLFNHLKPGNNIYWHPNRAIRGIEFHSGSLGHLLSVSIGVALDCIKVKSTNKVVVILGDGELNEGTNWESLLIASAYKLDNLLVIVDRNNFQANMRTEELIPLEPLDKKFEAFGCAVKSIDGHSFSEIEESLQKFPFEKNKPSVIIANTVRGKGLPSIENRADRWFCKFNDDEVEQLINELHGNNKAVLTSEKLIVR